MRLIQYFVHFTTHTKVEAFRQPTSYFNLEKLYTCVSSDICAEYFYDFRKFKESKGITRTHLWKAGSDLLIVKQHFTDSWGPRMVYLTYLGQPDLTLLVQISWYADAPGTFTLLLYDCSGSNGLWDCKSANVSSCQAGVGMLLSWLTRWMFKQ